MALKTNYKDDIPISDLRKYQMRDNGDGTVSFVDVTEYEQEGDTFGAGDINATNQEVNEKLDSADIVDPALATVLGFAADAKLTGYALGELTKNLLKITYIYNSFTMEAGVERIITPEVAGCKINKNRIVMALPFLVTASSGNKISGIFLGVESESTANVKMLSTNAQNIYVKIYYIYI